MYFVLLGLFSIVGWGISSKLKGKFNHYSKIGIRSGMTGQQIALSMLDHYNISGIKIVEEKDISRTIIIQEPKLFPYLLKYFTGGVLPQQPLQLMNVAM